MATKDIPVGAEADESIDEYCGSATTSVWSNLQLAKRVLLSSMHHSSCIISSHRLCSDSLFAILFRRVMLW